MSARQLLMVVAFAAGCLIGGQSGSRADTYSEQQLDLAGRIGAAVAFSKICSGTVPTTAVVKTLEASGLEERDILDDTRIRETMERQASAVMSAHKRKMDSGGRPDEIVRSACNSFKASFGPNGLMVPDGID